MQNELKKAVELLNESVKKQKCFRHRIYEKTRRCRLCDALTEAKGKIEYARKLFIGIFNDYGY